MLKYFLSLILSFIIVAFGVYFSLLDKRDLYEVITAFIGLGGFILILLIINLEPSPHPDIVKSANALPLWEKLKIYWAVIVAGFADLVLIILEFFLGIGN